MWDDRRHVIFSLSRICTEAHSIIMVVEPQCAHVYVTECEPKDEFHHKP